MTWEWESETDSGTLICRPLVPERFDDVLEVFGETGVARKCACMHWRRPDGGYPDERPAEDRFRGFVVEEEIALRVEQHYRHREVARELSHQDDLDGSLRHASSVCTEGFALASPKARE